MSTKTKTLALEKHRRSINKDNLPPDYFQGIVDKFSLADRYELADKLMEELQEPLNRKWSDKVFKLAQLKTYTPKTNPKSFGQAQAAITMQDNIPWLKEAPYIHAVNVWELFVLACKRKGYQFKKGMVSVVV